MKKKVVIRKKKGSVRDRFRTFKEKVLDNAEKVADLPERPQRKLVRKKLKVYVEAQCMFHENGERCKRKAVGSSQLCKMHGGQKDLDNVLDENATKALVNAGILSNTKFDPAIHPLMMIDLSREGKSDVEVAAEIGIGVSQLRKWAETYDNFATAYEIGQALYESWWLEKGRDNLTTRNFNTTLFKFLTGNKLGYADKVETKNLNMNTCGVLVVPEKVSVDEWEAAGVNSDDNGKS